MAIIKSSITESLINLSILQHKMCQRSIKDKKFQLSSTNKLWNI